MSDIVPVNILLVEDNQDHADLVINSLQEFNIKNNINHVHDGEAALSYLHAEQPYSDRQRYPMPHIIFMDIRMSRMDGITTLEKIKRNQELAHIPVVMVSTSKIEEEIKECYRLGASGFVSKPLKFDEFTQKIKELNHYWVITVAIPDVDNGT